MGNKVLNAYNVEVLRFTAVDNCGRPIYGPCSTLVTDCFETIEQNADIEEGDAIESVNANGRSCFYVTPNKRDHGFNIVAMLNQKNPALYTTLNPNWQRIIDEIGDIIGFEHVSEVSQTAGVAIEGWELVAGAECDPDTEGMWDYFLYPYVTNFSSGDAERGNSAHQDEWQGHTAGGSNWGVGPYDIRYDASDGVTPTGLLTPVTKKSHWVDLATTMAPPEVTTECIPLSNPAGPPATLTSCDTGTLEVGVTATNVRPMQVVWGDGTSPEALTTAVEKTHTYTNPGRYIVTVRFTDAAMEETYIVVNVPCA